MSELKTCPLCGGDAKLDTSGDSNFSMIFNGYASVKCDSCELETPWFETKPMKSLDDCNAESDRVIRDAINFWNNRPHENKLKAEAVREAIHSVAWYDDRTLIKVSEIIEYANKLERGEV